MDADYMANISPDLTLFGTPKDEIAALLRETKTLSQCGRVVAAIGTTVRATGLDVKIGQQCLIVDCQSQKKLPADVVGLENDCAILLPLGDLIGIAIGAEVQVHHSVAEVPVGESLLGRVLDGLGKPIDGHPLPEGVAYQPLYRDAPNPLTRELVNKTFVTGVRVIDSMLTIGRGQRVGIFASAGGGKSTLLGMLTQHTEVDIVIVTLIGERGREVREFLEYNLGAEGRKKAIVIVATSDRPPMERVRAAYVATAIAEGLRDQGKHVLLLMDSVTRFARALREIGLAVGEPAVRQGFPPSVFAELPRLFERSGNAESGSITAFYTVLVEDEDVSDPIAEEVRSILDGHIILTRKLSQAAHYPPIDVSLSASRVFSNVASKDHQQAALHLRGLLAAYANVEFLLQVGEYQQGSDATTDRAIDKIDEIQSFFQQTANEKTEFSQCVERLMAITYD